jgi:hypothetical protein
MQKRFGRGRVRGRVLAAGLAAGAAFVVVSVAPAAQAVESPVNVTLPSIVGDARVDNAVNGNPGEWTGAESYSFAWMRCTAAGDGCAAIPGATSANYTATSADANLTIRFRVTAHNSTGDTEADSVAVTVKPASGGNTNSIPVTELTARPDHLLIPQVRFSPSPFGNPGGTLTVEVKVTLEGTTKGVSGALVYITPLPYDWAHASEEVPTATDGRVAVKIQTTTKLPHKGALVMQIRARAPGTSQEVILGGISTRRLVQVSLK